MVVSLREANGVQYVEHSKTPVDVVATYTHRGRKWKMKGPVAVVETRGSWKYGHELHITLHCDPLQVVEKTPNGTPWTRIELALPYNMGVQLLQKGLESVSKGDGKILSGSDKLHEWI